MGGWDAELVRDWAVNLSKMTGGWVRWCGVSWGVPGRPGGNADLFARAVQRLIVGVLKGVALRTFWGA